MKQQALRDLSSSSLNIISHSLFLNDWLTCVDSLHALAQDYSTTIRMDGNCNYDAADPKLYLGFDFSTQQV